MTTPQEKFAFKLLYSQPWFNDLPESAKRAAIEYPCFYVYEHPDIGEVHIKSYEVIKEMSQVFTAKVITLETGLVYVVSLIHLKQLRFDPPPQYRLKEKSQAI